MVSAINSLVSDCLFSEVVGFVKLYLTFTGRKSEKNSDFTQVFFCSVSVDTKPWLGGETSNIFYFHHDPWGDDPIWRAYFSNGLVQPPARLFFSVRLGPMGPTSTSRWEVQTSHGGGNFAALTATAFTLSGLRWVTGEIVIWSDPQKGHIHPGRLTAGTQ